VQEGGYDLGSLGEYVLAALAGVQAGAGLRDDPGPGGGPGTAGGPPADGQLLGADPAGP
jgi:hypothetical protein